MDSDHHHHHHRQRRRSPIQRRGVAVRIPNSPMTDVKMEQLAYQMLKLVHASQATAAAVQQAGQDWDAMSAEERDVWAQEQFGSTPFPAAHPRHSSNCTHTMDDTTTTTKNNKRSKLNPEAPEFSNGADADAVTTVASTFSPPPGTRFVLAWDIEKSGPRTDKHSMLAIGAVVVRVHDDKLMSSIRIFFKMEPGHGFSDVCRKEYWYDWERFPMNKTVLERIEQEGVDPKQGIQQFADWLDQQEQTYSESKLALATDNPASDARWVSHYFQKYLDRNPMIHPYGDESKYRRLHHSNAFARALSGDDGSGGDWCQRLRGLGFKVPPDDLHDHDPQNDALWIARLYTTCLRGVRAERYHGNSWSGKIPY